MSLGGMILPKNDCIGTFVQCQISPNSIESDSGDTAGEIKTKLLVKWGPTQGRVSRGQRAKAYIKQICGDINCNPSDLPNMMIKRIRWRQRDTGIRASSATVSPVFR